MMMAWARGGARWGAPLPFLVSGWKKGSCMNPTLLCLCGVLRRTGGWATKALSTASKSTRSKSLPRPSLLSSAIKELSKGTLAREAKADRADIMGLSNVLEDDDLLILLLFLATLFEAPGSWSRASWCSWLKFESSAEPSCWKECSVSSPKSSTSPLSAFVIKPGTFIMVSVLMGFVDLSLPAELTMCG